jgi:uncharacterized membrane protein YjjP (DUF1212 family)
MGNIVISKERISKWREESRRADTLLKLDYINKQEEQLINSVKRETRFKYIMVLLLSATFCASLKRYFPETILTSNNFIFASSCVGIILPTSTLTSMFINQDIINKLSVIEKNHKILRGEF